MPLYFNTVLRQMAVDPEAVILVRHQDHRADKGRSPFELWRYDRVAFDEYQSHQGTDNRAKFCRAHKWASFVATPAGETLFAGMFDAKYLGLLDHDRPKPNCAGVDLAGSCDVYSLIPDLVFEDFNGKLIIDWGEGARAWVQRADRQNKQVTELRLKYQEDAFPGFLNFLQPLSKIISLPQTWAEVLRSAKGIYLLTCPRTHEQYVGSATGMDGLLGRWLEYYQTGHGGDVALKSREPSDYQVSILEVAGTSATLNDILIMEDRWKRKLQSREMGLNRN